MANQRGLHLSQAFLMLPMFLNPGPKATIKKEPVAQYLPL